MAKYKVVAYFTSVMSYRQVEHIEANSQEEAEEKFWDIPLNFSDPVDEDVQDIEVHEVIKVD